jgi:hypothetical protein
MPNYRYVLHNSEYDGSSNSKAYDYGLTKREIEAVDDKAAFEAVRSHIKNAAPDIGPFGYSSGTHYTLVSIERFEVLTEQYPHS